MSEAAPTPVITQPRELEALARRLSDVEFIAVDTEFVRDRTYYPRACVIQVATPHEHAIVDPLALSDLGPLRDVLLSPRVLKVLHAARQDLELFHHAWGEVPAPVFDTQVAAAVIGLGSQVSYATLVQELLGLQVLKGQTLTDWVRRPLTPEQVAYAAADVVHLAAAYRVLRARLDESGRAGWLDREMRELVDPRLFEPDADRLAGAVKGSAGLRPGPRAVLRELAAWRESEAQERDVPRRWVVSDDALIALARHPPADVRELDAVRLLPPGFARRSGTAVLDAVKRASTQPLPQSRAPAQRKPLGEDARVLADLLACLLRLRAHEKGVAAATLASRGDLERIAAEGGDADVDVLTGWRRELVGADLVALREGRLQLVVRDGKVDVVSS